MLVEMQCFVGSEGNDIVCMYGWDGMVYTPYMGVWDR
jgi:hypothetical protein